MAATNEKWLTVFLYNKETGQQIGKILFYEDTNQEKVRGATRMPRPCFEIC